MATSLQRRLGDPVVLPLEGPDRGHHHLGTQLDEGLGQPGLVDIQACRLATGFHRQRPGLGQVTPGGDHAETFDTAQAPHDQPAEIAVAPSTSTLNPSFTTDSL